MEKYQLTTSDTTKEIVVREGAAPKINEPQIVRFAGSIKSPAAYFNIRKPFGQITEDKAVIEYDFEDGSIELWVDKSDLLAPMIQGKLESNPDLVGFKINSTTKMTVKDLMDHLRMRRFFFSNKEQHKLVVSGLMNFKAKIETEIEHANNLKGNQKQVFETKLAQQLDMEFKIQIPLFKCEAPVSFNVEIMCDVSDGNIKFWLESMELEELVRAQRETLILAALECFSGYVLIQE